VNKVPAVIKAGIFGAGGIALVRECCLNAQQCAIVVSKVSKEVFDQKALNSANKGLLKLGLSFSLCEAEYRELAIAGIAVLACALVIQGYARQIMRPVPPPPAGKSPHVANTSAQAH